MKVWAVDKCTKMHPIIAMSCQISNVQASAVYTANDVLLCMSLQKQNCCFTNYPSHANWHAAGALIFSGTDTWV